MANDLLNELNRNLANAEETGNVEWAAALKKRIAQVEKAPAAPAASAGIDVSNMGAAKVSGNTVTKTAAKKTARKKK